MLAFRRSETEVHFRDWWVLGSEYVLVGELTEDAGIYRVAYELFDVLGERRIMRRQVVEGSEGQLRTFAHNFMDRVYEHHTRISVAIDTQCNYVIIATADDVTVPVQ